MESENVHIKYSDDETVVRDYYAAKIKKPSKGEAHVILTNRRVIIYYQAGKNLSVSDIDINEVRGADISWSFVARRKKGALILAAGIYAILFTIFLGIMFLPPVLLIAVPLVGSGIYYILKSRTTFIIIIYTKAISWALYIHNFPTGLIEKGLAPSALHLDGKPGPHAQNMANEIGIIIQDIQKGGERSIAS